MIHRTTPATSPAHHAKWRLLAGALLVLMSSSLLGSCVATPAHEARGMKAAALRLLALDFGRKATSSHARRLHSLPNALLAEVQRTGHAARKLSQIQPLHDATARASHAGKHASLLLSSELGRRPRSPSWLLPTRTGFARNTANNLDLGMRLLGPGPRPLNECQDRIHRVHYLDNRPEMSLWQRLLRRLSL